MQRARGEWIKFVFQDDWIAPNCLGKMVAAIKPGTMAIACRRDFAFEDHTPESTRNHYLTGLSFEQVFPGRTEISAGDYCEAMLDRFPLNFIGEPTALMLHRSVFQKFGTFNAGLISLCDLEYWTRVAIHSGLGYLPETLATFRVHEGSTTAANVASGRYRLSLDELVFLHSIVFDPVYAPLRLVASRRRPPVNLTERLIRAARTTRWLAVDATHRKVDPDPLLLKHWKDLVARYPRLSSLADGRVPAGGFGALRRFARHLFAGRHRENL